MLTRLFFLLLFTAFALPAAAPAACHGGTSTTPHMMTATAGGMAHAMREDADHQATDDTPADHQPGDHKAVAEHGCIGCIPPSAWTVARIDDVPPARTTASIERAAVFDIGMTTAPALRPPRTA